VKKSLLIDQESGERVARLEESFGVKVSNFLEVRSKKRFSNRFAGPSVAEKARDIKRVFGIVAKMINTKKKSQSGYKRRTWLDVLAMFDNKKTGSNNIRLFMHSAEKVATGIIQIAISGKKVFGRWGIAYQNELDNYVRSSGYEEAGKKIVCHDFVELSGESLRRYHELCPGLTRMIPKKILDKIDKTFIGWRDGNNGSD